MKRIVIGCMLLAVASATLPATAATNEPIFLAAAEARAAIVDESQEKYFSRLQPMEMAAKTGRPLTAKTLPAQRAETRRRYQKGVLEFGADEKSALRWYIAALQRKLEQVYPALAKTPWRFIKVADTIEGGLPHTRGDNIILSHSEIARMQRMKENMSKARALFSGGSTLVHELVHVHQRKRPRRYANLYRKEWGFVKADHIEPTGWMRSHQILNPDGLDVSWVYPIRNGGDVRWILPLVVLSDGGGPKRMPDDLRTIAVTLEGKSGRFRVTAGGDGGASMKPLSKVPAYTGKFRAARSFFHPNEIIASALSRVFVFDHMIPKDPGLKELREKVETAFAAERRLFRRFYR